ncbi:MAG: hypothetical protein KAT56_12240, partial [Sedimentisphaerales bacterium]|nr:hypothetical protein [Sedimentisphaerales bacterium]
RIVGHNWGTTGVNYDVLLSAANSTELLSVATGLTYFQGNAPNGSNPSELTTIAFRTAWGMVAGQPFVVDDVSLEGEASAPGNIIIDESDPLEVYEEGETQASFTVALSNPPGVDDVIVHLADDSDPNVVLVNPEELTFTQYNYNQPKTVLVKAIDDDLLNAAVGAVYYSTTLTTTAVSDSPAYADTAPKHVYVRIYDNECGAIGYNCMDFNEDCQVDFKDFNMFAAEWLSAEADNTMDFNDDCQVNIEDFATFADNLLVTDRRVIRNQSGWPTIFGLNKDESFCVRRVVGNKTVTRTVKLISVTEYWEPDYWIANNPSHQTLRLAEVVVDVSGEQATLPARPYQMPMVVNGLRLYVEATQKWAHECNLASIGDMDSDVRFSAVAEGEGWGPTDMRFPIQDYRWRSSSYNNTWASLVPYNLLYYHRGEDFGAIPERLPVMAVMDGIITSTPLPGGAYKSNGIIVATASGLKFRCSHMNIETFDPGLTEGTRVEAGQMLANTGETWN